jgi:hypothetical protein
MQICRPSDIKMYSHILSKKIPLSGQQILITLTNFRIDSRMIHSIEDIVYIQFATLSHEDIVYAFYLLTNHPISLKKSNLPMIYSDLQQ